MADFAALTCVLVLGVPHGALDGEIARTRLRPVFGLSWLPVFAGPYLSLAAIVLMAWRVAPGATLVVFLISSVWHFGEEDAATFGERGARGKLAAAALGGASVALPVLLHPTATAHFLSVASLQPMPQLPTWLVLPSLAWCPVALCWVGSVMRRRYWPALANAAVTFGLFAMLPPLPAFAAYFVCLHAPRHTASLIRSRRAARVRSAKDAIVYSAPLTALTFLIGAALWPHFPGAPVDRLLTLTIQGLSALTLPHMLLGMVAAQPRPIRATAARNAGRRPSAASSSMSLRSCSSKSASVRTATLFG